MAKDTTLFHLPLDEIRRDTTKKTTSLTNVGGMEAEVVLRGSPIVVRDPEIGTCLRLNGGPDLIEITQAEKFDLSQGWTFCIWLKANEADYKEMDTHFVRFGKRSASNISAQWYHSSIKINVNGLDYVSYQGITSDWTHFAFCGGMEGGKSNIIVFRNGVKVAGGIDPGNSYAYNRLPQTKIAPASLDHFTIGEGFKGQLAHARMYTRMLGVQEIKAILQKDKNSMTQFRETNLLMVDLYTIRDDNHHPIIYIEKEGRSEPLEVSLTNPHQTPVTFKKVEGSPSEDNYQVQWRFRRNVIAPKVYEAHNTVSELTIGDNTWKFLIGTTQNKREDFISFIHKDGDFILAKGDTRLIRLDEFSADPRGGARNTRVEVRFRTEAQDPGSIIRHLEIQSHLGLKTIPLIARIKGSSTVLNDGETSNELTIEIACIRKDSNVKLVGNPDDTNKRSRFTLLIDREICGPNKADTFNATTPTSGLNVQPKNTGQDQMALAFDAQDDGLTISEGNPVMLTIDNFITDATNGTHNLLLRYEDIPGYWDGAWVIPIELNPLVIRGGKVGIGTNAPKEKAHIEGNMLIDGKLLIGDEDKYQKALEAFNKEYQNENGANIKTDEPGIIFAPDHGSDDHAWIRFHSRSGAAHNLEIQVNQQGEDHLVLNPQGGKVGIGTDEPNAIGLHIHSKSQSEWADVLRISSDVENTTIKLEQKDGVEKDITIVNSSGNLDFYTSAPIDHNPDKNVLRLRISMNGNVGIGTDQPKAKLHVNGDLLIGKSIEGDTYAGKITGSIQEGDWDGAWSFSGLNIHGIGTGEMGTRKVNIHAQGGLKIYGETIVEGDLNVGGNLKIGNRTTIEDDGMIKDSWGTGGLSIFGIGSGEITTRKVHIHAQGGLNVLGKPLSYGKPWFKQGCLSITLSFRTDGGFQYFYGIDNTDVRHADYHLFTAQIELTALQWNADDKTVYEIHTEDKDGTWSIACKLPILGQKDKKDAVTAKITWFAINKNLF